MKKLIDLSHTVKEGLITYKGLPAPLICDFLSREESKKHYGEDTAFHIGKIEMVANTGTYIDAPFHRYEEGKDISELDLSSLAAIPAVKVSIPETMTKIGPEFFQGLALENKAVLIQTNWSRYWNTEQYYEGHPHLTKEAAEFLKTQNVALVGIDSLNMDDTTDGKRPAHTILLGADILIVEHMRNLEQLPESGFDFYAVPVKVKGMGTFPVRAFASV